MPTRVLYLSETLTEGGAQRVTSTLLNRLDRSKFVPSLCLLRDRITYPLPDDVAVHVLRQGGLMTLLRSRRRLRRVIADWKPDVMLSKLAYSNLFAGEALANRPKKVRWIARVGNNPVLENTNWRGKLQHLRLSKLYPMADAIVPNSNGLAQAFRNCFPTAAHLVRVIENPTDFEYVDNMASQPPPVVADAERPVVISVGRLTRQKRPDVLLEAFAAIHKEMPSAVLWILGD